MSFHRCWSSTRLGLFCFIVCHSAFAHVKAQELQPAPVVALQDSAGPTEGTSPATGSSDDTPLTLPPVTVRGQDTTSAEPSEGYSAPFTDAEVVTPNPTATPERKFGGTVRVITRDEIERSSAWTVGELLSRQPGIDVVSGGGPGGVRSIFMRGANSQHTKVLLDGTPLNDPSGPSRAFDAANLTLDNVERIEILQGPQSLLYGSEAIGGVVNILTRRGEGPLSGSISAQGGAYQTHREGGYVQGGNGIWDYSFSGSWLDTKSFSAAASGTENDPFELGALSGAFGVKLTETTEFVYRLRYTDARAHLDDAALSLGSPPTDDPSRINLSKNTVHRFELRSQSLGGNLNHLAAYDLVEYDRRDIDDVFPSTFSGTTRQFTYLGTVLLWPGHEFSVGTQHWDEEATTTYPPSPATNASQYQTGFFLQDQISFWDRLHLTAGVRWDEHSMAGSHQTYRTTAAYELRETGTRLRASLGTGYRVPSLSENLPPPLGNPDLRPEKSKGWEMGVDQLLTERLTLGATYFRNEFEDLILFDFNTFTLLNIGQARAHGVELTADWQLAPLWSVWGSYTHTDTHDDETERQLVRRPRDKGTFGITRVFASRPGSVTLAARMVGRRLDARDGAVVLPNHSVIDLYGDLWIRSDMRWFYRVDNLFNEQYEEITGFSTSDAAIYSGLEWRF